MGIPKFFRWLTRRYPMILQNVKREEDCPPIDNLYMDLNGIVHNCIHGNDSKKHEKVSRLNDLEDVWADIMRAIDEIVHSVKPRKVILLALDGVAPRAKMNQQRARRFRSAKDSEQLKQQLKSQGKDVPELFDSNQISPGTPFMCELGKQLEWFVKYKLNTDPLYQQCEKVLISDTSVPGEGEHKMMDFIRNLKREPNYDPNTRHCFYGSDADLIMLSLITHEPHFMIIREEHVVRKTKQGGIQRIDISRTANLQLIHISILREYFWLEYRPFAGKMKMKFDLERIIDDWVFFCFFIGNDFLPSLSALDISEGSLDHLINFYKKILPQMTDYITCEGQIYWDRAEQFIAMLGKHEHMVFINRVKTLDAQYENSKNTLTFTDNMSGQVQHGGHQEVKVVQQQLQQKLKAKKERKCATLFNTNRQKKYKKQVLLKRFSEDYQNSLKQESAEYAKYLSLLDKFKKLRETQKNKEGAKDKTEDEDAQETLHEVIQDIKEEYFSDLNPEEVPNSDVSDDNADLDNQNQGNAPVQGQQNQPLPTTLEIVKNQSQVYIDQNHQFMKDFVNTYKQDANEAKRNYYMQKLNFDVAGTMGRKDLHKMLYRYLEGMQWVYFYYYKGAQHWRWYYPYHYAPMISDLGSNIVQDFLGGSNVISEFKADDHCKADKTPYTPFQQLLCIFPVKSVRQFLPKEYLELAEGPLKEYFPADFDIDLNGRTLPWEAVVLIPFVDEDIFIEAETKLFRSGMTLSRIEEERNTIKFIYNGLMFDKTLKQGVLLPSTLKTMGPLLDDRSKTVIQRDYEDVGTYFFPSKMLPGVVKPQPGFPSLLWLNVDSLDFTEVYVQKVCFHKALVRVPQYKEDTNGADFEDWIYQFAGSKLKELYVNFPWQQESFPLYFEDPYSVYSLQGDGAGRVKVSKQRQTKTPQEFAGLIRTQRATLDSKGIQLLGDINTFVTVSALKDLQYDEGGDELYKLYEEELQTIPFNMIMKTRSPNHYLGVNEKISTQLGRFKPGKPTICFNEQLFGVLGKVKGKDMKQGTVKINIDRNQEQSKIHDPFMAENVLRGAMSEGPQDRGAKNTKKAAAADSELAQRIKDQVLGKRYFGDQEVEVMLNLSKGFINRITGSYLIAFDEIGKEERQVVDIGLNIKNFTKKVHVVEYVRFVAPHQAANTIYDEFQHNQLAHGANRIRKHWEYSQECVNTIQDYIQKYPEVAKAINAEGKKGKAMHKLGDLYPGIKKDGDDGAIKKLKALLGYLEALPISKLPYVEMGFDALDVQLIQKLQQHQEYMKCNYDNIDLNVPNVVVLNPENVYQEQYPYWYRPYLNKQRVGDFRVGNRAMNVRSVLREYLPFGARGTVVGKTEEKIIVLFDEQFLQGTTVYGHCEPYRGAMVDPDSLINLSRSFAQMASSDRKLLKRFQEKPQKGQSEFGQVTEEQRAQLQQQQQMLKSSLADEEKDQIPSSQGQITTANPSAPAAPPQSLGRGQRPKPEESKSGQASSNNGQQWVAKAKPFVPKANAPPAQPQMVYKAKQGDEGDGQGQAKPIIASGTGAASGVQSKPEDNQIDSSQGAAAAFQEAPQSQKAQVMFEPLPAFKLADPKLLNTAPEFKKITTIQKMDDDKSNQKDSSDQN